MDSIAQDAVILEVGGGYNPRFTKATHPNVYHLDHATTEALRQKYAAFDSMRPFVDRIQPVDFVFDGRPIDQLVPEALRFDLIYGSHVLEHQVDLIGHLQSLEALLKPGGRIVQMIPDLRTTFDALRYPTVLADALSVHRQQTKVHQGRQVFDALSRELDKNHGYPMCDADFEGVRFAHTLIAADQAMQAAASPDARYSDIHAWTFTPESFRLLMIELQMLSLTGLRPSFISPVYGNQFCAVLEPRTGDLSAGAINAMQQERVGLARKLRLP